MENNVSDILSDGEKIFDLECDGLKIIQHPKGYAFTTDAVLLANTVRASKGDSVLELGAGSGVIPLLISKKCRARSITALEIQPRLYDMARRSVELNGLSDRISVVNGDIRSVKTLFTEPFDVVCSNPPYSPFSGDTETATENDICRMEVLVTLPEVVEAAATVLKFGGKFYVIVSADRLTDLLSSMRKNMLEPKVLTPVQPTAEKEINTVIVTGIKCGKPGLRMTKPLIITNADGSYTEAVRRMYFNDGKTVYSRDADRKS